MDIKITKAQTLKEIPEASTLGFGNYFTDHMFLMDYDPQNGWHDARIVPFGNISLHPAATVFHYGAEIFEGLKAYRRPDGKVQLFRPDENVRRMNRGAERICLPTMDEDFVLKAMNTLIALEERWVPSEPNTTLYVRPFLFGTDEKLGVHVAEHAMFMIILSPVGAYYKEGLNPVPIMVETEDVRAIRGGTGEVKCGGNYGASFRAGQRAEEKGYSQVLWLDGIERKYIEEVGSMNVMFKLNGEVVTPPLNGSILPGITRMSCIEMLKDRGYKVVERPISLDELKEGLATGGLEEAWGCGTAALISPIGKLIIAGETFLINNNEIGAVSQELYDGIAGIQWGLSEDIYGWTQIVK